MNRAIIAAVLLAGCGGMNVDGAGGIDSYGPTVGHGGGEADGGGGGMGGIGGAKAASRDTQPRQTTKSGATPTEPGSTLRSLGVASYEEIEDGPDRTNIILQDTHGGQIGLWSGSLAPAFNQTITWHGQSLNLCAISKNASGIRYTLNGTVVDAAAAQEELNVLNAMTDVLHKAIDATPVREQSCTCDTWDWIWNCCDLPFPPITAGAWALCAACAH